MMSGVTDGNGGKTRAKWTTADGEWYCEEHSAATLRARADCPVGRRALDEMHTEDATITLIRYGDDGTGSSRRGYSSRRRQFCER